MSAGGDKRLKKEPPTTVVSGNGNAKDLHRPREEKKRGTRSWPGGRYNYLAQKREVDADP